MWCPFICRINDFNPSTRASLACQRKYVLKTEARTLLVVMGPLGMRLTRTYSDSVDDREWFVWESI